MRSHRGVRKVIRKLLWSLLLAGACLSVVPVLALSVVPVQSSSFIIRYNLSSDSGDAVQTWVAHEQVSAQAKLAVIAAEDQRFAEHFGFDLRAISRAIEHNSTHRRKRGASTISQQTAKNLFLWPGRSWIRKGLEVGYTLLIELCWSKKRILEVYLNIAEFGEGIYGVEAAAQHFFGKPASQLDAMEASVLAAVLPNPKRFKVHAPSPYVWERASWIRAQMRQLGMTSVASY